MRLGLLIPSMGQSHSPPQEDRLAPGEELFVPWGAEPGRKWPSSASPPSPPANPSMGSDFVISAFRE